MKWIEKTLLGLMTAVAPVYIACAYGSPWSYSKSGKVIDAETREDIAGIKVACIIDDEEKDWNTTSEDGDYTLGYNEPCDFLRCEDIDGEENGGLYQTKEVPFDDSDAPLNIELTK